MLIERDAELEQIDRSLLRATAGDGAALLLSGPAGIGKTTLAEAAATRAAELGLEIARASGGELATGAPYGVIRQLLAPLVRTAPDDRQVAMLNGAAAPAAQVVLGAATTSADPIDQGFSVVHGLYWLIANLSFERALLLLVDDVHWADAASLRALDYVGRRLEGLPLCVIATIRTGDDRSDPRLVASLEALPGAVHGSPRALSTVGVAAVLAADFGRQPDAAFASASTVVTGGNPLLVRELAAALKAERIMPTAAAVDRIANAAPATIARQTVARLGRLPNDAVELARAIAVLGGDATLPRAAALVGLDGERAAIALDMLTNAEVMATDGTLAFRHPIIRTAVHNDLDPEFRADAHHRAATLLTVEGADLDAIAGHLLASPARGDVATIATLRQAAAHAIALGAPDAAAAYLDRALDEGPDEAGRPLVLLELGTAEQLAGLPAADSRFNDVLASTDDPMTRANAHYAQALLAWYGRGDVSAAVSSAGAATTELAGVDSPLRWQIETFRAGVSLYDRRTVTEFERRRPELERAVIERRTGTRPLAMLLAACAALRNEPRQRVTELFELGWDEGRYIDEHDSVDLLPQGLGALELIGDVNRAKVVLDRFAATTRARGSVIGQLLTSSHRARAAMLQGDLTAAAAEMRAAFERASELQLQVAIASIVWYCSDVLLERPDAADIAAVAETLELGPLSEAMVGALLLETRGRLRFAAGRRDDAIADLRRAGAVTDALHVKNSYGCPPWRSTLALMLGGDDREEALALIDRELADARESGLARNIGPALRARGILDPAGDGGLALLEEAVQVLEPSPARLEHARALVDLGTAQRTRRADRLAARRPLSDGLELATRCGAVRLAERARAELIAAGARPRREHRTGRESLTPSELRVVTLAAEGQSTRDIAQALFVTTKTVDAHLGRAYRKLGINSRRELAGALDPAG